MIIDRSALIFDLVTRLSNVLNSKDLSDSAQSASIIQRLIDCCSCLKGNYRRLSALEQSTLTLLLGLATKREDVRLKLYPPAVDLFFTIEEDPTFWGDKFENGFGKNFLINLLKCTTSNISEEQVNSIVSAIVSQLQMFSDKMLPDETSTALQLSRGFLEAIGASDFVWIPWAQDIIAVCKRTIRFALPCNKPWSISLAASVMAASGNLVRQYNFPMAARDKQSAGLFGSVVSDVVETAALILGSSECSDLELKRDSIVTMAACVRIVPLHRESTFQYGLKLLRGLRFLGIGTVIEFDSRSSAFTSEFVYDDGDLDLDDIHGTGEAADDILCVISIFRALKSAANQPTVHPMSPGTESDSKNNHSYLVLLAQQMSRATIHMAVKGWFYEASSSQIQNQFLSKYEEVCPNAALVSFLAVAFDTLKQELMVSGFESSICKRFFQIAFECCYSATERSSSGLQAGTLSVTEGGVGTSRAGLKSPSVGSSAAAFLVLPESSYYLCQRMIDLIGSAVEYISHPLTSAFVYAGLLDLLTRVNRVPQLTAVVARQLVRLAMSTSQGQGSEISLSASEDDGSFLDLVIEALLSSYSRTFAQAKSLMLTEPEGKEKKSAPSEKAASINGSVSTSAPAVILEGLASAIDGIVEGLNKRGDTLRLVGIRHSLVDLFTTSAGDVYDKLSRLPSSSILRAALVSQESSVLRTGSLLGTLLRPLASSFIHSTAVLSPLSSGESLSAHSKRSSLVPNSAFTPFKPGDLTKYRDLWYNIVIFRLKENSSWLSHPEWLKALQLVASRCPPLLLGLGAGGVGFLDKEISRAALSKTFVVAGEGEDKADIALAKALRAVAKFNVDSVSTGQLMFAASVQLLEALRAGGSLDMRSVMLYLSDPGVDSSPSLRDALRVIANYVFSVYLEAASARLREYAKDETETNSVRNVSSFLELRSIIGQVFEFIVARCAHRHSSVREAALQFVVKMADRFPWLMWSATCISVLLDTVQHLAEQERLVLDRQGAPVSVSPAGFPERGGDISSALSHHEVALPFALRSLDASIPDDERVAAALLPLEALPDDSRAIAAAALPLLEIAYSWLFVGMRKVPIELSAVLQRYMLSEKAHGQSSAVHLGISIAEEAATNAVPIFHQSPSIQRQPLSTARAMASSKICTKMPGGDGAQRKAIPDSELSLRFAFEIALKSRYLGEIRGMQLVDGVKISHSDSPTLSSPSKKVARIESDAGSHSTLALAVGILNNLEDTLHNPQVDWTRASVQDVDAFVEAMWRGAAAAHILSTGETTVAEDAVTLKILQTMGAVAVRCFCKKSLQCLTTAYRWLVAGSSSTNLRRVVTVEACAVMLSTARAGRGLWHLASSQHGSAGAVDNTVLFEPGDSAARILHSKRNAVEDFTDPSRPDDLVDAVQSHKLLVEFFSHILETDAFNTSLVIVTSCMNSLLSMETASPGRSGLARTQRTITARFHLLSLGVRLLRKAITAPGTVSPTSRRVLRERIIRASLEFFDGAPLWTDPLASASHAVDAFAALWEFYVIILDEAKVWSLEYQAAVRDPIADLHSEVQDGVARAEEAVAADSFLLRGRAPGASAAVQFYRSAMGYEAVREYAGLPLTVLHAHGELGIFTPSAAPTSTSSTASTAPVIADKPSARLSGATPARVHDSSSTRTSNISSGVLCLLRMLLLQELDRLSAWAGNTEVTSRAGNNSSSPGYVTPAVRRVAAADYRSIARDVKAYKLAVRAAWAISPTLAIHFRDRYPAAAALDGRRKGVSAICSLVASNPLSLRHSWEAVSTLIASLNCGKGGGSGKLLSDTDDDMKELLLWAPAPAYAIIDILNRHAVSSSRSIPGFVSIEQQVHYLPGVVRYCIRSLSVADPDVVQFFLPQLIQILRRDQFGALGDLLVELSKTSALVCHKLVWLLETEAVPSDHRNVVRGASTPGKARATHGHCGSLEGPDPLPAIAKSLIARIRACLSPAALHYLDDETHLFNSITNISAKLRDIKDKDQHSLVIAKSLKELSFEAGRLYLPISPHRLVDSIDHDSGLPMQSAAKCPYLLVFRTVHWEGPDSAPLSLINASTNAPSVIVPFSLTATIPRSTLISPMSPLPKQEPDGADTPLTPETLSIATKKARGVGKKNGLFTIPKKLRFDLTDSSPVPADEAEDEEARRSPKSVNHDAPAPAPVIENEGTSVSISVIPAEGRGVFQSPLHQRGGTGTGANSPAGSGHFGHGRPGPVLSLDTIDAEYLGDPESKSEPVAGTPRRTLSLSEEPSSPGVARIQRRGFQRWVPKELTFAPLTRQPSDPSLPTATAYPHLALDSADSQEKDACIFKVYDDCRQDALTIQVVRMLRDQFAAAGLPLYLMPYSILPNRTGDDKALGGILQVIPNVKSRDQIGKAGAKSLLDYFVRQFGSEGSYAFKQAQYAFASSLAGYAVVCYLMNIKDRHNGNVLIDDVGHIIHIDYGFTLGISPGGNLGFETAAFKLTAEMVSLLGGLRSELFGSFVDMAVRGFLVTREAMDPILDIVYALEDSGLPNFMHKPDNLEKLKARFVPEMTTTEAAKFMHDKVFDAADKWTTNAYDNVQKVQNNIY